MKNYNMILIEKQSKYQLDHQTKLVKYEYLTGEEILLSNQEQIIEQATLTYSPLGKANKNNCRSRKKKVKALENLKPKEQKAIEDKSDDKPSMQKETYNKLLSKRLNEIQEISKEIDFNNYFKNLSISPINLKK